MEHEGRCEHLGIDGGNGGEGWEFLGGSEPELAQDRPAVSICPHMVRGRFVFLVVGTDVEDGGGA